MAILIAMGSESSCVQVDVLCNVVRKGHASTPSFNKQVHIDYLEAGADIIITASYQATLQGFENKGYSLEESENLLRKSVEIALEARKRYYSRCVEAVNDQNLDDRILNQRPILVAASVGSYGAYLADGSEYSGDYGDAMDLEFLKNFHRRRVRILADAGPDLIAFETVPNKLEAQAFAQLIEEEELNIPAWLSFNSKDGVNVVSGDSLSDCVAVAESTNKIVAVGINCTPHRFISDLILSIKKQNYRIRRDFVNDPNTLKKRLMIVGFALLFLSSFLVIFMLVYLFLRHAEQFYIIQLQLRPVDGQISLNGCPLMYIVIA
ncbi:hypothetical protein CASFOL_002174 [Castilleja foliolosa]|uniref:Hcy-binding domain-containing protein n=1 Tax=Castilleja foliolosa TaxID=1961234 RepID=A0ABD3EDJ3_9LAMI